MLRSNNNLIIMIMVRIIVRMIIRKGISILCHLQLIRTHLNYVEIKNDIRMIVRMVIRIKKE